ncbi:hypothetical protein [Microbacterium deminutum]|uniref:YCII-related domain-containing protein n=1 Tax=Microbacterium deminutum TaxID=344164 RepID=A0ABN2RLY1_9MICO
MVDVSGISDEAMSRIRATTKPYTVVVLRPGPNRHSEGADAIIFEHGRRNMALRAQGTMAIVLPVGGDADISGIGVFDRSLDEVREIIDGDPGVEAGVFVYDLYESRGFPGDALP